MSRVIYKEGMISSFGLYRMNASSHVSGLEAETIARTDAMEYLSQYFNKTCGSDSKLLAPDWKKKFHSQGSEIFSGKVWKIQLEAKMDDVFPGGEPCK